MAVSVPPARVDPHRSPVAAARLASLAWGRFRDGWAALPREARRRWLATLGWGFILCALLTFAVVVGGRWLESRGLFERETALLWSVQNRLPWFAFHTAVWVGALGSSAMHIPVMVVGTLWAALARRPLRALSVAASYLLLKALLLAGWGLWDRPRPELIPDAQIDVPASLHAYPSGHMVQTVAVYGILAWFWIDASRSRVEQAAAWGVVALLAAIVALSRMRIDAHWPSDIVAGAVLGAAWLAVLIVALRRAERAVRETAGETAQEHSA